jgi:hypothetical protein
METKTDTTVATEIYKQLGRKARYMLGGKNFTANPSALVFKIGKNCMNVNWIRITLNGLDLYDIEFIKIHGSKITVKSRENNVYADMMHGIIEAGTGMRTSL